MTFQVQLTIQITNQFL